MGWASRRAILAAVCLISLAGLAPSSPTAISPTPGSATTPGPAASAHAGAMVPGPGAPPALPKPAQPPARTPTWLSWALSLLLAGLLILLAVLLIRRREHARQAEALEQAKSDFMTLASHQLRTPLSIIRGYVSMAEEGLLGELPTPLAEALPVVSGRAAEMEALVGDILLATELETGTSEMKRERVDLRDMVNGSAEGVRHAHPEAQLRLRVAADPIVVTGDRERISRAVAAVLEAAADLASRGGEVVASVRREGDLARADASAPVATATPYDDVEPLFVPFSHAAGARAGLGLHVARELARRHGGDLSATAGNGRITFVLRLPRVSA